VGPKLILRSVIGIGILLALEVANVSPLGASPARSQPPRSVASAHADPRVGPLTLLEASHRNDPTHFTPATSTVIPRWLPDSSARLGASSPLSAPLTYNRAGLQKEVLGFAPYWALSQEATWDYNVMSTVVYFGLALQWDGTWSQIGGGWQGYYSQDLVDMINRAHAAGDRVLISVESTGEPALNDVVTFAPSTTAALANIIGAISVRGVDGVNIDFEGYTDPGYPNIQTGLTNFMTQLSSQVHAKWPTDLVTIDTYSGAASWNDGLFRIDALAPVVDAMFIMAYDMSFSNMAGQAGPNAPMSGWTYSDTLAVTQYLTKAPASKIILGVPWYGYRFKTTSNAPYAATTGATATSYSQFLDYKACASPAFYWDSTAQSPWGVWYSPPAGDPCGDNQGTTEELYYDDTTSLGIKYDFVNSSGIRGMGIWALGYDGGAAELWGELNTYFSCPVSVTLGAAPITTEFTVGVSAGSCSVSSFDVQQYDSTLTQGWYPLKATAPSGGSASVVVEGFPGSSYQIRARAHSAAGVVSAWTTISTTVSSTATWSHPFKSMYVMDDYGGIHPADSPPLSQTAYWGGWTIARTSKVMPGSPQSGLVLDGYGGLHYFGAPLTINSTASWPGWDIARDFAFLPDGSGGYVLDGYGGLHPFAIGTHAQPPAITAGPSWPGWDVARKVVIFSDGLGGLVMDAYGGLHPFGIGGPAPAATTGGPYWPGWPIARDIALVPGTHGGYVLDGYGGLHPFSGASPLNTPAYWPGWDIARSVLLLAGSTLTAPAGYLMDGYGGPHPFGGAPVVKSYPYWPGWAVGHNIAGS
jgi:hypothetical protein